MNNDFNSILDDPTGRLISVMPRFTNNEEPVDIYNSVTTAFAYRPDGEKLKSDEFLTNILYSTSSQVKVQFQHIDHLDLDVDRRPLYPKQPVLAVDAEQYDYVENGIKSIFSDIALAHFEKYKNEDPTLTKDNAFAKVRSKYNPFEGIGLSIFSTRAPTKLAAINSMFQLTGNLLGNIDRKSNLDKFKYSSICEGPGAFVQYLQWHMPKVTGYGTTLSMDVEGSNLNWDTNIVDMRRFTPYYSRVDNTNDISNIWYEYSNFIMTETHNQGVMLATADGGFNTHLDNEELESSKLLFYEVLTTLMTVKRGHRKPAVDSFGNPDYGGSAIIKLFHSVLKITLDLIFILTRCFKYVYLFKPISSRPLSSEKYIVCKDMRSIEECQPWIDIMINCHTNVYDSHYRLTTSIFSSLPQDFMEWCTKYNNRTLERVYMYSAPIIYDYGFGDNFGIDSEPERPPKYNSDKATLLWSIPSSYMSWSSDVSKPNMKNELNKSLSRKGKDPSYF